jgi:uncharacterized protein (TIRG00374 family)
VKRALALAGLLLFAVIIARTGPARIVEAFRGASLSAFAAALGLAALMAVAKTWRWSLLLRDAGLSAPYAQVVRYFLVGNFLGLATPGRVGDFVKALYFAGRGGNSFARASATIFVDRVLDTLVLVLLAAAILLHERRLEALLPLVALGAFLALLAAKRRVGEGLLRRVFAAVAPGGRGGRVGDEFAAFYAQAAALLTRRRLALPLAAACAAYVFLVAGVARIAAGLHLDLPLAFVAASVILAIFASLVPISVAGLGSREAVLIACFARRDLPPEAAVSLSLVFFAIFYLVPAAAGAVFWQLEPARIPKRG